MRILANLKNIPPERVRFRELGHGQAVGHTSVFEMQFAKDELENTLRETYERFLEEAREEFALHGKTDPEALAALSFPTLRTLIEDHESVLEELVLEHLFFPLLEASLDNSERNNFDFVINRLISLRSAGDQICIDAEVYRRVSPPVIQP